MTDYTPLVAKLLEAVRQSGIPEKRLAKMAGLGESYFRDLRRGKAQSPSLPKLERVAAVLRRELPELVTVPPEQTPGDRARLWREFRGLPVSEVAYLLGVTEEAWRTFEINAQPIPRDLLAEFGVKFRASLDYLFHGDLRAVDVAFRDWLAEPAGPRPASSGMGASTGKALEYRNPRPGPVDRPKAD